MLTAVLAFALTLLATTAPLAGQSRDAGWSFTDDAFADLWFHGLAVVGFHGFGPMPLYSPEYAGRAQQARQARGLPPTALETRRGALLGAFQGDPAFEVLHFVPLYFGGVSRPEAVEALRRVSALPAGMPDVRGPARTGAAAVAAVLTRTEQRRTLALYLDALDEEWRAVVQQRRAGTSQAAWARLRTRWADAWEPALRGFLRSEGLAGGTVLGAPALGAEGRFLANDPARPGSAVVALGHAVDTDAPPDGALASLVRELCYPAVRRALGSFEGRFPDRVAASRVSDLAATRCGELLLGHHAPELVAAYRARFGLSPQGAASGFLSAAGQTAAVAAMEGPIEAALRREINVHPDTGRATSPPVGR